jgi:hypothetical protein
MKNTALSKIEIVALFREAIRDLIRAVCQGIPSALAVTVPEEYRNQAESAIAREIAQRFQVASEATFLAIDACVKARSVRHHPGH